MTETRIQTLADQTIAQARAQGVTISLAESCTGGKIAASLTDIAGASAIFDSSFVCYSNEAKTAMLGVSPDLLAAHGAVSPEIARAMAEGALARTNADLALAITGIAGPAGGSKEKPIGLVHIALARRGESGGRGGAGETYAYQFGSGETRAFIRQESVIESLKLLQKALA